jgi:DNA-binding protein H-NS
MTLDLETMSIAELKDLQKQVNKAIDDYEGRKKRAAAQELADLAQKHGFSVTELLDALNTKGRRTSSPAKYRHRENHDLTWTGKGRKPHWFGEAELIG